MVTAKSFHWRIFIFSRLSFLMNQYDNDLSKIEDLLHSDNPESIQVAMTLLESIQISNQKVYIEYVEKRLS